MGYLDVIIHGSSLQIYPAIMLGGQVEDLLQPAQLGSKSADYDPSLDLVEYPVYFIANGRFGNLISGWVESVESDIIKRTPAPPICAIRFRSAGLSLTGE
jgi:hypothetical protein